MSVNENQTRTSQIPDTKKSGVKPDVSAEDVVEIILRDHQPIKALIETLKDGKIGRAQKEPSFEEFVPILRAHALAEEQTLYVQMKDVKALRVEGFEGDTEHAIADRLVQEINSCPDDSEWSAKVKVLAEMVDHHIKEEESQMLPDVRKNIDEKTRKHLGQEYVRLKQEFTSLQTKPATRKNKIVENLALN